MIFYLEKRKFFASLNPFLALFYGARHYGSINKYDESKNINDFSCIPDCSNLVILSLKIVKYKQIQLGG